MDEVSPWDWESTEKAWTEETRTNQRFAVTVNQYEFVAYHLKVQYVNFGLLILYDKNVLAL